MNSAAANHPTPHPAKTAQAKPASLASRLAPMISLAIFVGAGIALRMGALSLIMPHESHDDHALEGESATASAGEGDWLKDKQIQLSEEKMQAAHLEFVTADMQPIHESRTVPGTIAYDEGKHLELLAPVDCVVREVLVEPGTQVAQGQPLVVLFSAEVGLARDEVLKREADLAVAKRDQQRASDIAAGVDTILGLLSKKPKLPELEKDIANVLLGDYREKLVVGYSKLLLAQSAAEGTEGLTNIGAISQRIVDERRSNREVAAAQFNSNCETAKFAALQDKEKARASAEQAARLLAVSQEKLATLVGPLAASQSANMDGLGNFTLVAPLAGRIEERFVVTAGRFVAGKPLFTLADTTHLWVSAEIHEQDWTAVQQTRDMAIQIRVPALKDQVFPAQVRFLGSTISPEKRSVPLIADLPNPEGKFKPGMFVWALLPTASERKALMIPSSAVLSHLGRSFVFLPKGDKEFTPVEVKTGAQLPGQVEVLSGISTGDKVVSQGTFYLKSELLLDREAE
ncbi:MAG: efflux RND transporter periplasmic adaptor subunit [Planctomycetaceae bacterium]